MRKADYAALADIIRTELQSLGHDMADECVRVTLRGIAREFAARASVDRAAFLKACGIE